MAVKVTAHVEWREVIRETIAPDRNSETERNYQTAEIIEEALKTIEIKAELRDIFEFIQRLKAREERQQRLKAREKQ